MYIAISGNIGSGKTSLTEILAERCNAKIFHEDINNPYLNDFYEDMNRWAFNLQIYFLGNRIKQAQQMLAMKEDIIQDRTVYEDAYIFASNLHEMGLMTTRDFGAYMGIFDIASHLIPTPDLLIYLKADVSTLISQIQKRGRAYEMSIQEDYLARLNDKYENWINNIYTGRTLVVDINKEDFILDPSIVDRIVSEVEKVKNEK